MGSRLVRVVVRFQFFRFVRMAVRAVFLLMVVLVLLRIACVGMLVRMLMLMFVFVDVVVFMSVHRLFVRVLMGMSMSVFVLVLVAVIVLTFHRISSLYKDCSHFLEDSRQMPPCTARPDDRCQIYALRPSFHRWKRRPSDTTRPGAR